VASHSFSSTGEPEFPAVGLAVLAVGFAWLLKAPRWVVYGALFALSMQTTHDRAFVNAEGLHDSASNRDECAEYAAGRFLQGQDPWTDTDIRFVPLTTGYSAVLFLSPFVALFGRINEAAFLFWCAMLVVFIVADVRERNGSFLPLSLAYLGGVLEVFHTQNWALDELYFPFVILVLAFALAKRGHMVVCGSALAICVLWRLNYAFACLGFINWLLCRATPTLGAKRLLTRLAIGVSLGGLVVIGPFVACGGVQSLTHGPLAVAYGYAVDEQPESAPVTRAAAVMGNRPASIAAAALRILFAVGATAFLGYRLRTLAPRHPFWHACIGGWMAQTVVWHPDVFHDYQLMLVLPAFLAAAFASRREDGSGGASTPHDRGFGMPSPTPASRAADLGPHGGNDGRGPA
jgi:hypothetical protein